MLRKDSMKLEKAKEKIKKDGVEVKQVSEKLKKDSVKLNKVKAKEQYKDNMGQQQQSAECVMLLLLARSEECRDVDKAELGRDVRELKLLTRMFDCTEGAIMVGVRDVRELKLLAMTKECMDMGKAKIGRDKELEAQQQGQDEDNMDQQHQSAERALPLLARIKDSLEVGKAELASASTREQDRDKVGQQQQSSTRTQNETKRRNKVMLTD